MLVQIGHNSCVIIRDTFTLSPRKRVNDCVIISVCNAITNLIQLNGYADEYVCEFYDFMFQYSITHIDIPNVLVHNSLRNHICTLARAVM